MSVNELSLFINTNDRDKLMSVNELSLFINTNDRDTLMSVNKLSLFINTNDRDTLMSVNELSLFINTIKVITKLPNSEQSYKGKVKTHNYINRQNQSTTGKL